MVDLTDFDFGVCGVDGIAVEIVFVLGIGFMK